MSGELTINGLYDECKRRLNDIKNPEAVITDNRTGFDKNKNFYKELRKNIVPFINDAFDRFVNKSGNKTITDNKKLRDILNKINSYISSQLKDEINGGSKTGKEPPNTGIKFIRDQITISKDKTYVMHLLVNGNMVDNTKDVIIKCDNDNISIDKNIIPLINLQKEENGLIVASFSLYGKNVCSDVKINAEIDNYHTEMLANVIEEEIHYPLNGFEFYPSESKVIHENKHKAFLYFDSEIVKIGEKVDLSYDSNIKIVDDPLYLDKKYLIGNTNIGVVPIEFFTDSEECDCMISAKTSSLESKLLINVSYSNRKDIGKSGLISNWETEYSSESFYKAYLNPVTNVIMINKNNEINQRYFGDFSALESKNPKNLKNQYYALFDLVAEISAKALVDKKKGKWDNIDDYYQEIQKQKYEIYLIADKAISE